MKFRKKPVVIEAIRWNGGNIPEVVKFADNDCSVEESFIEEGRTIAIRTLEGTMKASIGDWIIRGVKGELYPCKPDIFEATYEKVEE